MALAALGLGCLVGLVLAEGLTRLLYRGNVVTGSLIVDDPELGFALRRDVSCHGSCAEFSVDYATDPEYGIRVAARGDRVARFWNDGTLDPESNALYGEGGAGLFSDGKLTARSKERGRIREFMELLQ